MHYYNISTDNHYCDNNTSNHAPLFIVQVSSQNDLIQISLDTKQRRRIYLISVPQFPLFLMRIMIVSI